MSAADELKVKITATDDASAIMGIVKEHAKALGLEVRKAGKAVEHVQHEGMWSRFKEHISETGKGFGELGEHIEKVHESVGELVPQIGALGALGGAVGLVENVEHMAEAYGELAHKANALGMSAAELYTWNSVAKLTDTNAESLDNSMSRLNRTLGDAAAGRSKAAADAFRELHIDPKQFHNAAEAMPALVDAFSQISSTTERASLAQAIFGRSSKEIQPLLNMTGEKLREVMAEARKFTPDAVKNGEGFEHYEEAMHRMSLATDKFRYELAGKLEPVITPVINELTNLLDSDKALGFAEGGAALLATYGAYKGVRFFASEIKDAAKLGLELGKTAAKIGGLAAEWVGVGAAAQGAAAAELEADAAGAGAGAGGLLGKAGKWAGGALAGARGGLAAFGAAGGGLATAGVGLAAAGTWIYAYEKNKDAYEQYKEQLALQSRTDATTAAIRLKYVEASPAWREKFDALQARNGGHVIRDEDRQAAEEHDHMAPGGDLMRSDAAARDAVARHAAAARPTDLDLGTFGHGLQRSDMMSGSISTTITILGLPPGASLSSASHATGVARAPVIRQGYAFHDD